MGAANSELAVIAITQLGYFWCLWSVFECLYVYIYSPASQAKMQWLQRDTDTHNWPTAMEKVKSKAEKSIAEKIKAEKTKEEATANWFSLLFFW